MGFYSVRGRAANYAAYADDCIAALWNPHATKRLKVLEVGINAASASGVGLSLRRTTTRGTPGETVTPAIQQSFGRRAAPVSGAVLDLAYPSLAELPTYEVGYFWVWKAPLIAAHGIILPIPRGIEIPPSAGLAIVDISGLLWSVSEVWFCWEE